MLECRVGVRAIEFIIARAADQCRIGTVIFNFVVAVARIDRGAVAVVANDIVARRAVDRHIRAVIRNCIDVRVGGDQRVAVVIDDVHCGFERGEDVELLADRVDERDRAVADRDKQIVAALNSRVRIVLGIPARDFVRDVERIGRVEAEDRIVAVAARILDQVVEMSAREADAIVAAAARNRHIVVGIVDCVVAGTAVDRNFRGVAREHLVIVDEIVARTCIDRRPRGVVLNGIVARAHVDCRDARILIVDEFIIAGAALQCAVRTVIVDVIVAVACIDGDILHARPVADCIVACARADGNVIAVNIDRRLTAVARAQPPVAYIVIAFADIDHRIASEVLDSITARAAEYSRLRGVIDDSVEPFADIDRGIDAEISVADGIVAVARRDCNVRAAIDDGVSAFGSRKQCVVDRVVDILVGIVPNAVDGGSDACGVFESNSAASDRDDQIIAAHECIINRAGDFQRISRFEAVNSVVAVACRIFNLHVSCSIGMQIDNIIADIAFHHAVICKDGVITFAAVDCIGSTVDTDQIIARRAVDTHIRMRVRNGIVAVAAVDCHIVIGIADEIVAVAAVDRDIHCRVRERIIARAAIEHGFRARVGD